MDVRPLSQTLRPRAPLIAVAFGLACVACAAPVMEGQVPKRSVLSIDGTWALDEVPGVVYRIDAGRMIVASGRNIVPVGGVAVRDIAQAGPRQYTGFDLVFNGQWQAEVDREGVLHIKASGSLGGGTYTGRAKELLDPSWFEAQLVAGDIIRSPVIASQAGGGGGATGASGLKFGRYHALVIGNNAYQHLTPLRTARADARAVASTLRNQYGFETQLLLDAKREDILVALSKLRRELESDDNLLIYYAGHGWLDEAADEGYWLPVDASPDNDVRWISNATITSHFRALEAKHVLVVADSCFSGTLTRGIRIASNTPNDLERMTRRKARIVLSSGGEEPVSDGTGAHSAFATEFLAALRENETVLDTTSLYAKIRRPVMLASDQDPDLADIRKAGHDGGDFLFVPLAIREGDR